METDENINRLEAMIDEVRRHDENRDPEGAHITEDRLMGFALGLIASGCNDPQRIARLGLATADDNTERWYA